MLNTAFKPNDGIFSKSIEKKSTEEGFGEAITEIAKDNNNIVALCADLKESTKLLEFSKQYPQRFIQTGISEQNMIGMAAGLAMNNKIPFAASFSIFNPGRNWEQIRLSICFSNTNVKVVGAHSGLSHCFDGGMAQALEDIALMRTLPNMIVVHPADYLEAKKATKALASYVGPAYLRLTREKTPVITTEESPFEIGRAYIVKEGSEVTIISTGTMLFEALVAAKDLQGKYKINAEVINCPTIKPLDEKTIIKSAAKTKHVVTVEDHQIVGGLGGAIAELLSEKLPTKIKRVGVNDSFGESGTYEELKDKYGLSAHHIVSNIVKLLK